MRNVKMRIDTEALIRVDFTGLRDKIGRMGISKFEDADAEEMADYLEVIAANLRGCADAVKSGHDMNGNIINI